MKRTNINKFDEAGVFSSLGISNLNGVKGCAFSAGSVADEISRLGKAIVNEEELWVDDEGVIHTSEDAEGLSTLNTSNMTKVNTDPFAGVNTDMSVDEVASEMEMNNLGILQTTPERNICVADVFIQPEVANSSEEDMIIDDSALTMELDDEGYLQSAGDTIDINTDGNQEFNVKGHNMTRISDKPFAAPQTFRKPSNPDQWYNRNPLLFRGEVANMRKSHPNAILGFLQTTGNMYWIVETKIIRGLKPWKFLLEYEKDHPNNNSYGGSIHVQLMESPSLDELRTRAIANGRKGIPHVVKDKRANGEEYQFLCTREPKDVNSGKSRVSSATQVVGWAADWALHFEAGLRSKEVWNKWCDDSHFRHLMIP